jgi:hypothetical protein
VSDPLDAAEGFWQVGLGRGDGVDSTMKPFARAGVELLEDAPHRPPGMHRRADVGDCRHLEHAVRRAQALGLTCGVE